MKKPILAIMLLLFAGTILLSCKDDDPVTPQMPKEKDDSETNHIELVGHTTLDFVRATSVYDKVETKVNFFSSEVDKSVIISLPVPVGIVEGTYPIDTLKGAASMVVSLSTEFFVGSSGTVTLVKEGKNYKVTTSGINVYNILNNSEKYKANLYYEGPIPEYD
ncbi:MAG: hypothetical protein ACEPOV_03230 [Hyphomicrobiales bacterium]